MKIYGKKTSAWFMCLCCFFSAFYMASTTSRALTLEEVEAEMDAPLEMDAVPYGDVRGSAVPEEPGVQIGKTAHWLDIERGYAQIDLTETDTSGYTNQAIDYLIILDRTRTMALNDQVFEGSPSAEIGSGNSPCLNRDHYYEYNGQRLDLYDYEHGIVRGTNEVVTLPLGISPYHLHKNASGTSISVDYANGCMDRLTIAKDTICGLIDQIAANASDNAKLKSRVSYWSFAGTYWPEQEGELDTDPEKGLFNYAKLTTDYTSVKNNVQATKAYAGTYYLESLKRAYEQLTARTGSDKDMPSRVIFISDGKCADDEKEIMEWAKKLKAIPNCTVYTLAVGMPVSSDAAVLLKNMSSGQNHTTFAAFTTNLNSSNPAFADTLTSIGAAKTEVRATKKVLTDVLDSRYWEFVEVSDVDGTASVKEDVLTWEIPEGAQRTYSCSLKIRLKEEYRFRLSDTQYPTNYDRPEGKGCCLEYVLSGGAFHGETRRLEKETPYLKYGTIHVEGIKHFTVDGSEADRVTMYLKRELGKGTVQNLCEAELTPDTGWSCSIKERIHNGEILPLVLYTDKQEKWTYFLEEKAEGYELTEQKRVEADGVLSIDFYNEPMKIKARIQKADAESKELLSGARFGVYMYSKKEDAYVPYFGTDASVSGTARVNIAETDNGIYETEHWLYYTPDNEGRFRIMEEQAPEGYIGDYPDGDVTKGKNHYDICITKENTGTVVEKNVEGELLRAENHRVKGKIKVFKTDADSGLSVPQGNAVLFYEDETKNARYGLFTEADEQIAEKRINGEGFLEFDDLELGTYYIKELDTPPEGYLLNTEKYPVTLEYKSEKMPLVLEHVNVPEPIKKQSQKIYKIGGSKDGEEYTWIMDAGFMVFPFSSFGDAILGMEDEEILAYVDANYRNPKTWTYEEMKALASVTLYKDGKPYELEEIRSADGIYETPLLPYGDYVIAETTVPDKMRPVQPFIIHVREDAFDGNKTGDGEGTPLKAKVLRDEDVLCRIQIVKMDAVTKEAVKKGTAGYVIHDTDGAFREWFLQQSSVIEKAEYLLNYNGLVVEYDEKAKVWRGSYKHPFIAEESEVNGETVLTAVTCEGIPAGRYELEEVSAPEGYVLSGMEGRIAVREDRLQDDREHKEAWNTDGKDAFAENGTYYETRHTGIWANMPAQPVCFTVGIGEGHFDVEDGCWWICVHQENQPVIGKVSLKAEKEEYETDENGNRTGKTVWAPVEGEKFRLYAQEDICTVDGRVVYRKGAQIKCFTTNEEGTAWTGDTNDENGIPEGLYPGVYRLVWLKEVVDAEPVIREERIIHLEYQDEKSPVIYEDETFRIPLDKYEDNMEPIIIDTVVPKTGDEFPAELAVVCLWISLILIIRILYIKKRGRNK